MNIQQTQICHYFIPPIMKQEDSNTDSGMKRLRGESKVVVSREKICFTTSYFPEEIIIKILSDLDKRTLTIFGIVSKSAEVQAEKAWKNLRIRDRLNFSWISIPDNRPDHHKSSYQLNDAIVECYTHIGNRFAFNHDNLMRLKAYNEIYQKYAHVYEHFSEFRCFFNDVLFGGEFDMTKMANVDKNNYIRIADETKSGGELALKTMINRDEYNQDLVDSTITLESLHNDYSEAIEGNATFLALEGFKLCVGNFDEEDAEAFNVNSKIYDKPVNAEELLAIKAADKGDYNAIMLLISGYTWGCRKFTVNLKLPSAVWESAIQSQPDLFRKERSDGFTLLLYAKAIESYPLGQAPHWLLEEAREIVAKKKIVQDNYWEIIDEAPESLRAILYSFLLQDSNNSKK